MDKPQNGGSQNGPDAGEEEEDDYMTMSFAEPVEPKETSIQRAQRLKKESRARGIVKSKAQIAEEEAAARDKALSTSMLDDARAKKSKGLAMMTKMGFKGGSLGKTTEDGESQGLSEPIKVSMKEDRGGIGLDSERKRKMREAAEERDVKAIKIDPDDYRERVRKEREDARLEKQFFAAQRMAERMDDGAEEDGSDHPEQETKGGLKSKAQPISSRPLKSIPIIYRGLIRHREEQERDRRMRHDLEQSLSRLPTYEDSHEDEDDRRALGKNKISYAVADDLDEEDEELDEFNAKENGEKLRLALNYLRQHHHYCFWCKAAYPDAEMDGCPGLSEDDHD